MDVALVQQVRHRSGNRCEYCLIPQQYFPIFEIDHIIALKHGGLTILSNLANTCLHCNSHKGPNIAGIDPVTGKLTKLFHPRQHKWERHFRFEGATLVGRTAIGRTTIAVLNMNGEFLLGLRQTLLDEGIDVLNA